MPQKDQFDHDMEFLSDLFGVALWRPVVQLSSVWAYFSRLTSTEKINPFCHILKIRSQFKTLATDSVRKRFSIWNGHP